MFEYQIINLAANNPQTHERVLNEQADNGWELVTIYVNPGVEPARAIIQAVFKREKPYKPGEVTVSVL